MKLLASLFFIVFMNSCATYTEGKKKEERADLWPNNGHSLNDLDIILVGVKAAVVGVKAAGGLAKFLTDEEEENGLPSIEKLHDGTENLVCEKLNEQKVCSLTSGCECQQLQK